MAVVQLLLVRASALESQHDWERLSHHLAYGSSVTVTDDQSLVLRESPAVLTGKDFWKEGVLAGKHIERIMPVMLR